MIDDGGPVTTKAKFKAKLDLPEIRTQLSATRSLHSQNRRVTTRINNLLVELAHLQQPDDRAHEKRLTRMIAKTTRAVDRIIASDRLKNEHKPVMMAPCSPIWFAVRHSGK